MTLTGANFLSRFIERETLFVVRFDHFAQFRQSEFFAVTGARFDEFFDSRPAVFFQRQTDFFGLVPKDEA